MKFISVIGCLLYLLTPSAYATIDNYLNQIKNNPQALRSFFQNMPKGGELHYHLAGGVGPEVMLKIASKENYCLDRDQLQILGNDKAHCKNAIHLSQLSAQSKLYQDTIKAWSMKDLNEAIENGHDHFFSTFNKFILLVGNNRASFLTDIIQKASRQNELYMEIMILADNAKSTAFSEKIESVSSFKQKKTILMRDKAFQQNIKDSVAHSKNILKQARQNLACMEDATTPECQLTIKFHYYVLREQSLDKVFAQALTGFAAAQASSEIVAVNLVQAEDGPISTRDYHKQMEIFNFLHKEFPSVHISLHAGELSKRLVSKKDLSFHIRDAIETGKAERIGHGVTVLYEKKAPELLEEMKNKQVAVEINLSSNEEILNVKGKEHPLSKYIAAKVPVVLSSDDEGILGTDLSTQFMKAFSEYQLDYETIKKINRSSLNYSFLEGKSLWEDVLSGKPVKACTYLYSKSCREFILANPKAKIQWQLEERLRVFEASYAKIKGSAKS